MKPTWTPLSAGEKYIVHIGYICKQTLQFKQDKNTLIKHKIRLSHQVGVGSGQSVYTLDALWTNLLHQPNRRRETQALNVYM